VTGGGTMNLAEKFLLAWMMIILMVVLLLMLRSALPT